MRPFKNVLHNNRAEVVVKAPFRWIFSLFYIVTRSSRHPHVLCCTLYIAIVFCHLMILGSLRFLLNWVESYGSVIWMTGHSFSWFDHRASSKESTRRSSHFLPSDFGLNCLWSCFPKVCAEDSTKRNFCVSRKMKAVLWTETFQLADERDMLIHWFGIHISKAPMISPVLPLSHTLTCICPMHDTA